MSRWTQLAREAFANAARILGDGRWSVSSPDGTVVYLCVDERQQRSVALGVDNPVLYDLKPKDFSTMPDLEDADERRKRRRAQQ
jgi:hypothetical protein